MAAEAARATWKLIFTLNRLRPPVSCASQQGCTTLTPKTLPLNWVSNIQTPKTTGDISHSNHPNYQINIQKSVIVLYSNNELSKQKKKEKERKEVLYIITSKKNILELNKPRR